MHDRGRWSVFDTCEHCMAAQRWLQAQCGGYLHGGVQLDLEELLEASGVGHHKPEDVRQLTTHNEVNK